MVSSRRQATVVAVKLDGVLLSSLFPAANSFTTLDVSAVGDGVMEGIQVVEDVGQAIQLIEVTGAFGGVDGEEGLQLVEVAGDLGGVVGE